MMEEKKRRRRPCQICTHPQRLQIELELIRGAGAVPVARKWGLKSETSVKIHRAKHMTSLLAAAARERGIEINNILDEVLMIRSRWLQELVLALADVNQDKGLRRALAISKELASYYRLIADLLGFVPKEKIQLDQIQGQINAVRQLLVDLIRPYPDLALKLERALAEAVRLESVLTK